MTSTNNSDHLVPVTEVAAQLGYRDAAHWREIVAPSLAITPVRQGARWFVWRSQFDRALAKLTRPSK